MISNQFDFTIRKYNLRYIAIIGIYYLKYPIMKNILINEINFNRIIYIDSHHFHQSYLTDLSVSLYTRFFIVRIGIKNFKKEISI